MSVIKTVTDSIEAIKNSYRSFTIEFRSIRCYKIGSESRIRTYGGFPRRINSPLHYRSAHLGIILSIAVKIRSCVFRELRNFNISIVLPKLPAFM